MPYRKSVEALLKQYKVNEKNGLSEYEAKIRLDKFGRNELEKAKKKSGIELFMNQFLDPMVIILMIGAGISLLLKEYIDSSIIGSVIIINATIGVFQEKKAEKAIEALEKLSGFKAKVIREGFISEIDSKNIVLGDIVVLETGNYIPADIRLIETFDLKVEESTLTGESETITKDATVVFNEEEPLHIRKNMVFMACFVSSGKAKGIVTATGMQSEVGKVAYMLKEEKEDKTPLQKRLAKLSFILGIGSVLVCFIMFTLSLWQGRNILDVLLLAISLAVAAIPEGLPAVVTIVLALGVQRMSKKDVIVRKLHAVETLGSVSVICSDKTGTLTQNKMKVVDTYSDEIGNYTNEKMFKALALCNTVSIQQQIFWGEATEVEFVRYAQENGFHKENLEKNAKRIKELAFDSTRKMMSTLYEEKNHYISYTKGALESVLPRCTHIFLKNKKVALTKTHIEKIIQASDEMSEQALRVLAIAYKDISNITMFNEENLIFIGLIGMMDMPRENVKESIHICCKAGIQVNMITGDNAKTAYAIAKQLNIACDLSQVIEGKDIDLMSDYDFKRAIQHYRVFARVTPAHKVKIVKALKENGKVVAMSGDGVNDAPSLKSADIGIAMGKSGSDVSKQASDMILADDNFNSIVHAIAEGRNIYLNIQKAILYLLSCNLGEIMSLFMVTVCMPNVISALHAVQILWVNLVTDAFPALALGVDPKDKYIMLEKPRPLKESLFANGGASFTILNGMLIGTMTIVAFRFGLDNNEKTAQTMAFMVLSMSQLFHALNLTSRTHSIFEVGLFKNKWLILTILFGITLQICVTILPIFHVILKTVPLNIYEWIVVFFSSSVIIIINELSKFFSKE